MLLQVKLTHWRPLKISWRRLDYITFSIWRHVAIVISWKIVFTSLCIRPSFTMVKYLVVGILLFITCIECIPIKLTKLVNATRKAPKPSKLSFFTISRNVTSVPSAPADYSIPPSERLNKMAKELSNHLNPCYCHVTENHVLLLSVDEFLTEIWIFTRGRPEFRSFGQPRIRQPSHQHYATLWRHQSYRKNW